MFSHTNGRLPSFNPPVVQVLLILLAFELVPAWRIGPVLGLQAEPQTGAREAAVEVQGTGAGSSAAQLASAEKSSVGAPAAAELGGPETPESASSTGPPRHRGQGEREASGPIATAAVTSGIAARPLEELGNPNVAEQLRLSPSQRAEIAAILAERKSQLEPADESIRPDIIRKFDTKLWGVLTPEQKAAFAAGERVPVLRFQFRFQRWEHVLEWLAQQAGLSLVLDAPPPGTFNYTDNREYTPTEAIDLVNSVLLTKGYALVRREGMLILLHLKGELPPGLVPRVSLEEARRMGKHDLVTVSFSTGRRNSEQVSQAVKALLGPYGKLLAIPGTNQILVTERAGTMDAIEQIIQSIPEPSPPPPQPKPREPEPFEVQIYPLKTADPNAVLSVLTTLFSSAKIVHDPKLNQLNVYATPSQHNGIKSILARMESQEAPERAPRLETYPVATPGDGESLVANLQLAAPAAKLRYDEEARRLIVWGSPAEHEAIKLSLEKLQAATAPETAVQLEAYRLLRTDPRQLALLLEKLVPRAKVTFDSGRKQLLVLATPADHALVRATIQELEPTVVDSQTPELRIYELQRADPELLVDPLSQLAPRAQITADEKNQRLIILAPPELHETIAKAIREADAAPGGQFGRRVAIYPLRGVDLSGSAGRGIVGLIERLAPNSRVTVDSQRNQLVVYASEEDHRVIREALSQLGHGVDITAAPTIEVYPIRRADSAAIVELLRNLVPGAQVSVDSRSGSLVVLATANDHQLINETLAKLATGQPGGERSLVLYPTAADERTRLQAVLTSLSAELPGLRVISDAVPGSIAIWATAEEHQLVSQILQQLKTGLPEESQYQLVAYPLQWAEPSSTLQALRQLYPQIQVVSESATRRLLIWASAKEHEAIRSSLAEIDRPAPEGSQPRFETYYLRGAAGSTVLSTLQQLVPSARLVLESGGRKIVAWATPKEHETIRAALAELGEGDSPERSPQMQIYPLGNLNPSSTMTLLQSLVPDAQLSIDSQSSSLVAVALPADHEVIRAALDQLRVARQKPAGMELRYYPYQVEPAQALLDLLRTLAPSAQVTVDRERKRLMVVAYAEDHTLVEKTLKDYEANTPAESTRRVAVFNLSPAERKRLEALWPSLQRDLPGVQLLPESRPGEVAIWARPEEQQLVAEIIRQLQQTPDVSRSFQLLVYPISAADPQSVLTMVQTLFPNVQAVLDQKSRRVMIWTPSDEYPRVLEALREIDRGTPGQWQEQLRIYPVSKTDPQVAVQLLRERAPEARITVDSRAGQLVVWATLADHKIIEETLEQLEAGPGEKHKPRLVVYPAGKVDTSALATLLRSLVPEARIAVDSKTGGLAVWAKPEDHELIAEAIEELSREEVAGAAPVVRQYDLPGAVPSNLMSILAGAFPLARFSLGTASNQLIAWAKPEEHQLIAQLLEELSRAESSATAPRLATYTVQGTTASEAARIIRLLVPEATLTVGSNPQQLIAWARPADHEKISQALQQLAQSTGGDDAAELVVYNLRSANAYSAMQSLRMIVPEAQLSVGSDMKQLIALARPAEHRRITAALERIDVRPPEEEELRVYSLEGMTVMRAIYAMRLLRDAVPEATMTLGSDSNQLLVWARPEDHQKLQGLLDQLLSKGPPEKAPQAVVYQLRSISASAATQVLRAAIPDGTFVPDASDPYRLTVWGSPADQQMVERVLNQIDIEDQREGYRLATYELQGISPSYAIQLLTRAVPGAQLLPAADPQQLIAWARPQDHERIQQTLEDLRRSQAQSERTAVVYTLKTLTAATAMPLIRQVLPQVQLTSGTDANQFIAWASPADHEAIRRLLAEVDLPGNRGMEVRVYRLEGMDASQAYYARYFLISSFPNARVTSGVEADQVIIWATPADHEQIAEVVGQLTAKEPPEKAKRVALYTLRHIPASQAVQVLRPAVPQVSLSVDTTDPYRLIAFGSPRDHESIAEILGRIDTAESALGQPTAATYTVEGLSATYVIQFLSRIVPTAQFSMGSDPQQFMAFARPQEHERIRETLEQLKTAGPSDPRLEVYPLETGDSRSVLTLMQSAVPTAKISTSSDGRQLLVYGRPEEQRRVQEILDTLARQSKTEPAVMEVYTVRPPGNAYSMMQLLRDAFPQARFALGSNMQQLVVYASAEEHRQISEALARLEQGVQSDPPKMRVYDVGTADPSRLTSILAMAFPNAQFAPAGDPGKLVAWAQQADHRLIEQAVGQLRAESWGAESRVMLLFPLRRADAQAVMQVLSPTLREHAQFVVDPTRNALVVWADRRFHEAIRRAVEQYLMAANETPEMAPRVYRFRYADPSTTMTVLRTIVPDAQIALDWANQTLVISALPEEHLKIEQTLAQMDREDAGGLRPVLRVHRMDGLDPSEVYSSLRQLFRYDLSIQLALDEPNESILAIAPPTKHEVIARIIEEIRAASQQGGGVTVGFYSLKNIDPSAALSVLRSLMQQRGVRAELSLEPQSNQLVAITRPEYHAWIEAMLEQMRGEDRELEILQLEEVDVYTAQTAIRQLFADESQPPEIDVDYSTQQLFVQATAEQHRRILELLGKMGESRLALVASLGGKASRVIRFEGDAEAAVRQIERVWSQLRPNPLRIITPAATAGSVDAREISPGGNPRSTGPRIERKPAVPAAPNPPQSPGAKPADDPQQPDRGSGNTSWWQKGRQVLAQAEQDWSARLSIASFRTSGIGGKTVLIEAPFDFADAPGAESTQSSPLARGEATVSERAAGMPESAAGNPDQKASKEAEKSVDAKEAQDEKGSREGNESREAKHSSQEVKASAEAQATLEKQSDEMKGGESSQSTGSRESEKNTELDEAAGAQGTKIPEDTQEAKAAAGGEIASESAKNPAIEAVEVSASTTSSEYSSSEKSSSRLPSPEHPSPEHSLSEHSSPEHSSEHGKSPVTAAQVPASGQTGAPPSPASEGQGITPQPQEKAETTESVSQSSTFESPGSPGADRPASPQRQATEAGAPPVYLIPGEGTITVVSDDEEAAEQLESLLRTLSPPVGTGGRTITVYELRHASATVVAETLQDFLRSGWYGWRRGYGSLVIVPDEQQNTILVQASRADRALIESLLKVLDAPQLPEAAQANQPRIIPVRNADAARVEEVVRSVFRAQLNPPTVRASPWGGYRQVAPGPTTPQLTVDPTTNSLVVRGPPALVNQIEEFIKQLDETAAQDPSRRLILIPLEKLNATRVERALEEIIRRSRWRGYP